MIRCLWAGERRANSVAFSTASASSASVSLSMARPQNDLLRRQPDIVAHLPADEIVVAGEDLDDDAVLLQGGDRGRRAVLGGIEERDVADQDELAFVVF